jgi:hypothetical protein
MLFHVTFGILEFFVYLQCCCYTLEHLFCSDPNAEKQGKYVLKSQRNKRYSDHYIKWRYSSWHMLHTLHVRYITHFVSKIGLSFFLFKTASSFPFVSRHACKISIFEHYINWATGNSFVGLVCMSTCVHLVKPVLLHKLCAF